MKFFNMTNASRKILANANLCRVGFKVHTASVKQSAHAQGKAWPKNSEEKNTSKFGLIAVLWTKFLQTLI